IHLCALFLYSPRFETNTHGASISQDEVRTWRDLTRSSSSTTQCLFPPLLLPSPFLPNAHSYSHYIHRSRGHLSSFPSSSSFHLSSQTSVMHPTFRVPPVLRYTSHTYSLFHGFSPLTPSAPRTPSPHRPSSCRERYTPHHSTYLSLHPPILRYLPFPPPPLHRLLVSTSFLSYHPSTHPACVSSARHIMPIHSPFYPSISLTSILFPSATYRALHPDPMLSNPHLVPPPPAHSTPMNFSLPPVPLSPTPNSMRILPSPLHLPLSLPTNLAPPPSYSSTPFPPSPPMFLRLSPHPPQN
ncbi:hypothetical protein C8J57DRAFT_1556733, partial [Mycena rebaudengoi]